MRFRLRSDWGDELGSVTAELVIATPAVLAVVALAVAGVGAAAQQVSLEGVAGDAARAAARGELPQDYAAGAAVTVDAQGDVVCVELREPALFGAVTLTARSCADARGW